MTTARAPLGMAAKLPCVISTSSQVGPSLTMQIAMSQPAVAAVGVSAIVAPIFASGSALARVRFQALTG